MQEDNNRRDITGLEDAFDAAERDARALVSGLTEPLGAWRLDPESWSVAECLDHLAIANRVYLRAMQPAAERALTQGRRRRRPAQPGLIGTWFVRTLEPPAKPGLKSKAHHSIQPRHAPSLADRPVPRIAGRGPDVSAALCGHRPGWRALPQPIHSRRSIQPCHRPARDGRARAAPSMAGLAAASVCGTCDRRMIARKLTNP